MILQLCVCSSESSYDSSNSHTSCPLDVIIECAILVPIFLKEAECIVVSKVLKLDQTVLSIALYRCLEINKRLEAKEENNKMFHLHELINKFIISLPSNSLVPQSNIVYIIQQLLPKTLDEK